MPCMHEKGQLKKIHQKNKEHENEEVLEDDVLVLTSS